MAGIYFHIPFCKKACHYCDFHFTTTLKYKDEMLGAMLKELELRQDYLQGETINSIYFGGGTPSIMPASEIQRILDKVYSLHNVASDVEITLEANPDDLENKQVVAWKTTDINRFSIGIQSFFQEDLSWMNRAHDAQQADSAIKRVQDAGFENITADLIYGYPLLTDLKWKSNIDTLLSFGIPHVSAYAMTVEDKTALGHFVKKGKQPPMNEAQSAQQFMHLSDTLSENGFEHYEISNFAHPDMYSKHNTSYWKGINYLGIGPSAHSFDGLSRSWNIANNPIYIDNLKKSIIPAEIEALTTVNRVNEYIMTSLRTSWGTDLKYIENTYDRSYAADLANRIMQFNDKGWLIIAEDKVVRLTRDGKLFADHISAELFFDDEDCL